MKSLPEGARELAGRAAYEASCQTGINGGMDLEPWEDLSEAIKEEWMTVADAVVSEREDCD